MPLLKDLRAGPALPKTEIRYPSTGGLTITGLMCRPAGDGPFPVIAINHGGFDPASSVGGLVHLFAKLGYVAVASDYRGTGGSDGRPEMAAGEVDDVLALLEWVGRLPFADAGRTVMMGVSHGGKIALLAAAREPSIRAVLDLVGPTDTRAWWDYLMSDPDRSPNVRRLVDTLLAKVPELPFWDDSEWARRSPIRVADRIGCPTLLIYGAADDMVPLEQGVRMHEALRAAGKPSELIIDPEAGHYFDAAAWERIARPMIDFLNRGAGLPPLPETVR
jgi:dipeptidyl aminopeptidase/acylaminoacyl peptidase